MQRKNIKDKYQRHLRKSKLSMPSSYNDALLFQHYDDLTCFFEKSSRFTEFLSLIYRKLSIFIIYKMDIKNEHNKSSKNNNNEQLQKRKRRERILFQVESGRSGEKSFLKCEIKTASEPRVIRVPSAGISKQTRNNCLKQHVEVF